MPRNTLAVVTQFPSNFMPSAEAVDDHDLVPKSSGGFDGGNAGQAESGISDEISNLANKDFAEGTP